ncbi:hypothetical protein B0T16DRAFT_22166 [Cercophora newfieldiana]|uniref:Extracellular membrane protein CFEM domain-containing protein n=1 Tax=Cercophora newfieldiana TaxID=92897 RepID=A0AA40CYA8_9PEZI|nr:hypothetical protein B0T16DRAFT_22166 [Cercophora newfieldiana]
MKTAVTVLALAASAAATGFRSFPPFSCPENTDNKCDDKQKPGFSFGDLNLGPFTGYNDFNWKGFTCGAVGGNGRFNNGGSGKSIGGTCTSDKKNSPSFGCGPKIDKFSLGSIVVKPEFDCDLEFHYDMPDGKTCKHRSPCKKSGTTVVNKQCGGAKNVTIIFPPQPNKPKPVCSIDIHTISFDCLPPKTTFTPPPTTVQTTPTTTPTTPATTPTTPATTPTTPATSPSTPASSPSVPASSPSVPASSPVVPPSSEITTETSTTTLVVSSTVTVPTTTELTTTIVTSFETTSTVFSTVVSTITSCAPTVPNCPGGPGGVTTTVVTVAISTTICPVTETLTTVLTTTTDLTTVLTTTTSAPVPPTEQSTTLTVPVESLTSNSPVTTQPSTPPVDTLPCPDVVPKCLNTFLFDVKCADNSDHKCYCPDSIFVKNVMECIFAHGETETIISESIIFFQGICAPFVPSNPGIVTAVPTYVTVTAPPTAVIPIFTTVTVDATTVVPCTDDTGEIIPSSSTTSTITTTLTLPQVGFTTQSGSVGVIPVTLPPFPVETPNIPGGVPVAPGAPGAPGFFTTTAPISAPIGTGGIRPNPTGAIVTAGSGRVSAGLGFSVAIAVLAAMGL